MAGPVARTRPRLLVATAVAALLLFVLSGCVKFNADFHVDAEETLTGTMQILVDPIALEDMGSNPSSELDDAVSDAQADPELPDGVTVDRVEDEDGFIGMGVTFDRVPATELQNGGSGLDDVGVEGIEVVNTDGEISFTMANPLTAGMDSSDPFGASGMPSSARSIFDEAIVSITFPGDVIAADGAETNGKTATWNLREYDGDTLTATGDASSFPWGIVLIAGGVLLFLFIVAGVIILLLVAGKRRRAPRQRVMGQAATVGDTPSHSGASHAVGPPYPNGSSLRGGPGHRTDAPSYGGPPPSMYPQPGLNQQVGGRYGEQSPGHAPAPPGGHAVPPWAPAYPGASQHPGSRQTPNYSDEGENDKFRPSGVGQNADGPHRFAPPRSSFEGPADPNRED